MNFILRMAWRDSRASRQRLALVSLSVVLGIAALVGIASFGENLKRTVEAQTKALLGSDLAVTSHQPFSKETLAYFQSIGGERGTEISRSMTVTFTGHPNQSQVQLRTIEGGFPFYGELVTSPAGAVTKLGDGSFAVIDETLLARSGVQIGDELKIGKESFTISGTLKKVPGEFDAVSMFFPRIYVSPTAFEKIAQQKQGAFGSYREHFKLPVNRDPEVLMAEMKTRLASQRLQFATVEQRKRTLGTGLKDLSSFFSLVGFIALFLGAVGVASAIHVYVRQKIVTVAVLRCLGASARASFLVYLTQGLFVGVLGALIGASLGVAVQMTLPLMLKDFLPFPVETFVSWLSVLKGSVAGLVICVLFSLLPLLSIRRVSPLLAIRSAQGETARVDPLLPWIYVCIGAAITGFAILQTGHWKPGLAFSAMMAFGFGSLAGVARFVAFAARRFVPRKPLPYVWRQGLANLHRPNNRTVLLLLSLGLGMFLLLTLVLTRATMLAKISGPLGVGRPNLMFFDVQDDQIAGLTKLLQQNSTPIVVQAPIVTLKLSAIAGCTVDALVKDNKSGIPPRVLTREYRTTYRDALAPTETITEGKFVPRVSPGEARVPVSVEERFAKDLLLKLDDEIVFDVQGVPMTGFVSSIRHVDEQRMLPNFPIVFPAGVLEPAPKTFVVAARTISPADSARVQRSVTQAYPNISAVDIAFILQAFDSIFSKVEFAVTFMAAFTVGTGIIILVSAILTGRFQRIRETVLLRTLGATGRQLRQIQLVEYGVLGVLAAVTGAALASIATALLARFAFHTPVAFPPLVFLEAISAAVAITLVTGLLTNRGIVNHPPLQVLRQET